MKNLTVSIPDDVYRDARIRAAEQGRSVSAMVVEYLATLADQQSDFERLLTLQQEVFAKASYSAAGRLSREGVHDRAAIR